MCRVVRTTAITHLLTQKDLDIRNESTIIDESWEEVLQKASNSEDVHTLKFAYTNKKLYDLFNELDLQYITNKRVDFEIKE